MSPTPPAPYLPDSPTLLPFSLGQVVTVEATHPSWTAPIPLELTSGSLSFDERRAPRCVLTMTARVPTEQAVLDALDPRTGVRLRVRAGYLRPDGPDVQPVADLQLRDRRVSRPADTLTLTGWGDEGIVLGNLVATSVTGDLGDAVVQVLGLALGYAPTMVERTMRPLAVQSNAVVETQDPWTQLEDWLDRADADLYDDGLRGWHLIDRPVLGTPAHELTVGAGGTLTGAETTLTREGWHNAASILYRWTEVTSTTVTHELDGGLGRTAHEKALAESAAFAKKTATQAEYDAMPDGYILKLIVAARLEQEKAAYTAAIAASDAADAAYSASGTSVVRTETEKVVVGTAAVTAGPYAPANAGGRRVFREERDVPTTQAAANGAAATLLGRRLAEGRTLDLEAITAWWLRPGHTVAVRLPSGGREAHLVVAVDANLTSGRMRVATRLPDATTVITPGA